jgi:hypothetical protein
MVMIIRDDAGPRFVALASLMRWNRKYAKATVIELWENSQAAGVWEGSSEDILFWSRENSARIETKRRLIDALQNTRVRFISQIGEDLYRIHGNEGEIKGRDKRRESARIKAEKRWDREHGNPKPDSKADARSNAGSTPSSNAPSMPPALPGALPQQCLNEPERTEPNRTEPKEDVADAAPSVPLCGKGPRFDPEDLQAATWFQRQVKLLNPQARLIDRANLKAWANEIRLMRERDHIALGEIAAVMEFALLDPFWRIHIQSPHKLRLKWDQLTAQMTAPRKAGRY